MPFTKIQDYLKAFYGLKISTSGLSRHVIRVSEIMKDVYDEILGDINNAITLFADVTGEWAFYYYPLDMPTSPNGGWVGLSEIVALGDDNFAVIERDNQSGPDARIKKIYEFSVAGLVPQTQESGNSFPLLGKTLVRDLIPDLTADSGLMLEKVEGLMVTADGDAFIVTDNDGVDDSSGETQLINLGSIF